METAMNHDEAAEMRQIWESLPNVSWGYAVGEGDRVYGIRIRGANLANGYEPMIIFTDYQVVASGQSTRWVEYRDPSGRLSGRFCVNLD